MIASWRRRPGAAGLPPRPRQQRPLLYRLPGRSRSMPARRCRRTSCSARPGRRFRTISSHRLGRLSRLPGRVRCVRPSPGRRRRRHRPGPRRAPPFQVLRRRVPPCLCGCPTLRLRPGSGWMKEPRSSVPACLLRAPRPALLRLLWHGLDLDRHRCAAFDRIGRRFRCRACSPRGGRPVLRFRVRCLPGRPVRRRARCRYRPGFLIPGSRLPGPARCRVLFRLGRTRRSSTTRSSISRRRAVRVLLPPRAGSRRPVRRRLSSLGPVVASVRRFRASHLYRR